MNNAKTVDQTPYTLANNFYQPQEDAKTKKQKTPGMTRSGKDIVDLTEDKSILGSQTYQVMHQDVQLEVTSNPYQVSIQTRSLALVSDEDTKAKLKEIGNYRLPTTSLDREFVGWEFCDPKKLVFWGWITVGVVCIILPLILFIASDPSHASSQNAPKIIGFGCWLAVGAGVLTLITGLCYHKEKFPTQNETSGIISAAKRRDLYYMYRDANNKLIEKRSNDFYTSKSKKDFCQRKIEKWFNDYRAKIEGAQLNEEDRTVFQQLLSSHQAVFSNLIVNCSASWTDNEGIMAENLKHLLCSQGEQCRQLAETWATDFEKFGRGIFR